MRKFALSMLALALTVVLVGCGEDKPATKATTTVTPTTTVSTTVTH